MPAKRHSPYSSDAIRYLGMAEGNLVLELGDLLVDDHDPLRRTERLQLLRAPQG
jgi:hypothetical protein